MRAVDILRRKRLGQSLHRQEISFLIREFCAGRLPDYQMSAFLMAVCIQGMDQAETQALTEEMLESGEKLDLSDLPGVKVDKHSTGGGGDKTSLIIAPLAAAGGLVVPMISGRGLGHSGGTLDKLEAIPGFRIRLSVEEIRKALQATGLVIVGQTEKIAPADRKMYALRDVTGTIDSLPLITGSILSKKLAEGISGLVLDVKVGSGAFMKTEQQAFALAKLLSQTARGMGKRVVALVTDMDQPLGQAVGNAIEVEESIAVLRGEGPPDLTRLSLILTAHMLYLGGVTDNVEKAETEAAKLLSSGKGLEKLEAFLKQQGGDPRILDTPSRLPQARYEHQVLAERSGYVHTIDTEAIGTAAMLLGAGRRTVEENIDAAAGIRVHHKLGEAVDKKAPLCTLRCNDRLRFETAASMVANAYGIEDSSVSTSELVRSVLVEERTD